jgi:RecA/RadA recombinase
MVKPNMILPSGVALLDHLLAGGLRTGLFVHVYGEAASGKTTLALQFIKAAHRLGYRSVYINSEGTSPIDRLEQIMDKPFSEVQENVRILIPKTFSEQAALIEDFELYAQKDTGLLVIDTLTKLYRLSLEDKKTNYVVHRELNRQAGLLKGLAFHNDIPVLVLNQVRAKIGYKLGFEPVAKNILDYWSDYEIRMRVGKVSGERVLERTKPKDEIAMIQKMYLTASGLAPESTTSKKE